MLQTGYALSLFCFSSALSQLALLCRLLQQADHCSTVCCCCFSAAAQFASKEVEVEGNYNEDGLMLSTQPCGLMECDEGCSCSSHCKVGPCVLLSLSDCGCGLLLPFHGAR